MTLGAVRGVLFDLDGTLYDLGALKRLLVWRVPGELLNHGPLGAWRRLVALQTFRRAREAHRGSPPTPALRRHLVATVADELGYPRALVDRAVADFLYESAFPELRSLADGDDRAALAALAYRGYRLGVVSEYPVARKVAALGLGNVPWGAFVDCEEVGTLKPQPEVFEEGARRLGLAPDRVLMVGDRLDADITGAEAVGMKTAWLPHRDPGYGGGPLPDVTLRCLADLLALLPQWAPIR